VEMGSTIIENLLQLLLLMPKEKEETEEEGAAKSL